MVDAQESPPIVSLEKAGRCIDGRWLFRDLTLGIRAGDSIGLMGANGSGKSVLMRSFCGLERLDEGDVKWRGDWVNDQQMPIFRRRVLYMPQRPHLLGASLRDSVAEAESFHAAMQANAGTRPSLQDTLDWLERPREFAELAADRMSGGELLVAALAQAITLNPQVLLLDEPTAALDDATRSLVEQRTAQWMADDERRAIVWVTHDVAQAARVASIQWRLEGGHIQSSTTEHGAEGGLADGRH